MAGGNPDLVDWVIARWAAERPDLDTSSIAVVGRLLRIAELLERRLDAACRAHGVSLAEFAVLSALRRAAGEAGLSPGELSRTLLISSGGVTRRVATLETRGLLTRTRDTRDGRGVLVALTPRGRHVIDTAAGPYLDAERRALASLDARARARLAGALRPLLASLDDPPPPR